MILVSLEAAKLHLHITDPARDAEVLQFLEQASARILLYLGARGNPLWDETTTPPVVQSGVLLLLGWDFIHRGDDADDSKLWEAISLRLMQSRDPALA